MPVIDIRPRQTGDQLRLSGGRKSLKKLMIDRKIPSAQRALLPVFVCGGQVFAVYGLGADASWTADPGERAWVLTIWQKEKNCNDGSLQHDE